MNWNGETVLWYVSQIADVVGLPLDVVAESEYREN